MFLTFYPKPIDPPLKELVEQIEQQSPAGVSVLAARQFRYKIHQTAVEITITEPRNFNVLEEFILRAAIEFSPPPTKGELASVLGLDPVFVQRITTNLQDLQILEIAADNLIAISPQGREFYARGSVPKPPQTKEIFKIADPLNGNLVYQFSPLEQTRLNLPNLDDFVSIEQKNADSFSSTLEKVQQAVQSSGLGLHVPEEGKILTSFRVSDETQSIWQSISIFVIFDPLEDEVKLQARRGKQILEYASNWLDNLLAEGKIPLNNLCQFSEQTIGSDREFTLDRKNEELEARIDKIKQIAIENLTQSRDNSVNAEKSSVILLPDSQIRQAFLDTLNSARQDILIFSPWLSEEIIDDEVIRLLQKLAKRDVSILIGYGIATQQEEEKIIPASCKQRITEVKTPDNLPAVQIVWLGNSDVKEVVVDKKIHIFGFSSWVSFGGDILPRGETVYKVTTSEQVEEAYGFLTNQFKKQAENLWSNAVENKDFNVGETIICVWAALGMEEEALNQIQQNSWLELFPVWLKVVCQGLRSKKLLSDANYFKTALVLLSEVDEENQNIESLREEWQKIISAIATQNSDAALNLLTEEIWTDFIRLGIAKPPIDSPQKFILQYAVEQQKTKKPTKTKPQTASKRKRGNKN